MSRPIETEAFRLSLSADDLARRLAAAYLARPADCQFTDQKESDERRLYLWECHVIQHSPDDWQGDAADVAVILDRIVKSALDQRPGQQLELAL